MSKTSLKNDAVDGQPAARKGDALAVEYACFDTETGAELENSGGDFEIMLGDGSLLPALEKALAGMTPGQTKEIVLPPEKAFGPRCDDATEFFPFDACEPVDDQNDPDGSAAADHEVSPEEVFQIGSTVQIVADDGTPFFGKVSDIDDDGLWIDMNHPMAGRTLKFRLTLVEIIR